MNSNFSGRIFQVIEALDYGDACSNQAIELDSMLRQLGFSTTLYSKFHHEAVSEFCCDLQELKPTDNDIVILHFSGYSEYALPHILELRCTKVCIYHNITPHEFFAPQTYIYQHCLKGRKQLVEITKSFHYFWGDSKYNLQELVDLGADSSKCAVLPIIVGRIPTTPNLIQREQGIWIFLGRIAANKGQVKLVKLFADIQKLEPDAARKLCLIGGYSEEDPYYQQLITEITVHGLSEYVVLTNKISDKEVDDYLCSASVYVSMSEHEGFGVPLIEASHHNLPVVALNRAAIGETLGGNGLADSEDELGKIIISIHKDKILFHKILEEQRWNASRFSYSSVENCLLKALRLCLPSESFFSTVSVVICTYNRSDLLERCLDYLQYQTNQNFEVIVVNGPSTDKTDDILQKYKKRIKIAENPERNLSISRNLGIELASGDLIAFIDDDALPFDDWIETIIREFNSRPLTLAGIGGPVYYAGSFDFQMQDIGINKFAEVEININSCKVGKDGIERSLLGTNTCFRAEYIRHIHGFDEQFDYFLDESELCFRLQLNNYIISYCPDLYLRHEFAQSHNRSGKFDYNWFTICKNTAYYIAAYSGLKGIELREYLDKRMYSERIQPIEVARNSGEISDADCQRHVHAIRSGFEKGLLDAIDFPKIRELKQNSIEFHVFTHNVACQFNTKSHKKLHICILSKEFPPFVRGGGIGTLYYNLASELLLMGHYVSVVVPSSETSEYCRGRFLIKYTQSKSVYTDANGSSGFENNMNWSLSAFHTIAELHKEHPIDVIDSALWDSEALALALLPKKDRPVLVIRLVTPFLVAMEVNNWAVSDREVALYTTAERTLIENADVVIPISESIATTIETKYKIRRDKRWRLSHCGIAYWSFFDVNSGYSDLKELYQTSLKAVQASKMVLFIGRLEMRKGIDILLAAANEFLATDSDAYLVIAGRDVEGWIEKSKTICNQDVLDRIIFLGDVDDVTREKLLHAAYCLVFPSRYESFGLVPLEAFVHGLPVVASNSGAIPEVVEDGYSGLLFHFENSNSLAHCVINLLKNEELRFKLSNGAKNSIRRFSSRISTTATMNLYIELIGK
jgi:glycosyltransferase involved in cell wall biosynthesis